MPSWPTQSDYKDALQNPDSAFRAPDLKASQAEDGCIVYSYAEDIEEPGLIRIFEAWRDRAALGAHGKSAHLAVWREAGREHGVSDRRLTLYEVASETPL